MTTCFGRKCQKLAFNIKERSLFIGWVREVVWWGLLKERSGGDILQKTLGDTKIVLHIFKSA